MFQDHFREREHNLNDSEAKSALVTCFHLEILSILEYFVLLDQLERQISQRSIVEIAIGLQDLSESIERHLWFLAHNAELMINTLCPDSMVQLLIQVGDIADPILEISIEILALKVLQNVGHHLVNIHLSTIQVIAVLLD